MRNTTEGLKNRVPLLCTHYDNVTTPEVLGRLRELIPENLSFGKLDKNTTYILKQTSSAEGYEPDAEEYTYYVDTTGHIKGSAKADVQLKNFIPRAEIDLRDILLHTPVSGKKLSLYDNSGKQLSTWTTGTTPEDVTNLPEGSYYILQDGSCSPSVSIMTPHPMSRKSPGALKRWWRLQHACVRDSPMCG